MSLDVFSPKQFKIRDLRGSKVFRKSFDIFGESSIVRKRVINAQSVQPLEETGLPPSCLVNSVYAKPRTFPKKEHDTTTSDDIKESEQDEYHNWLKRRRDLRDQLERLGNIERWLNNKECNPSEKKVLEILQSQERRPSLHVHDGTQEGSERPQSNEKHQKCKKAATKKTVPSIKRPTPQAIAKLEDYVRKHRLRLVDMFTRMDKDKDWLISCKDCQQVFKKLRVPISDEEISELMSVLDSNDDGHLDYRELLSGRLSYKLEKRQRKKGTKAGDTTPQDDATPQVIVQSPEYLTVPETSSGTERYSSDSDDEDTKQQKKERMKSKQKQHLKAVKKSPETVQTLRMKQHIAPSTYSSTTGQRTDHYRQEELKHFQNLLVYCRARGVVLNQSLLERALLSPGDHSMQECIKNVKQPGPILLSSHFADAPVEENEIIGKSTFTECFGGPYLELRGPHKGQVVKLSTGTVHIKSKTDCWLTFEDYRKLTEHIKSRFPFRYHGIPGDSVFWPGHLLHKLRLCMPPYDRCNDDKVASVKNLFQPVHRVQTSVLPPVSPRVVWPLNNAGYVQSGNNNRKSYAI